MQLAPEARPLANVVAGYSGHEIRLRDRVVEGSAIVTPDRVLPWAVSSVEALTPALLEPALALGVGVVILATGARQRWPAVEVLAHAAARGVGLEVMEVGAACRTYNLLVADERPVALAAILDPR